MRFGVLFLITCVFFLSSHPAKSESLISESDKELIFFFSLECAKCYEREVYLSAWESATGNNIKRVPFVYGDEYRDSALLFFLLELSKDKYPLSDFQRVKAGYSLASSNDFSGKMIKFSRVLKEKGMEFSNLEFVIWWKKAQLMVSQSELVTKEALKESPQGVLSSVRVSLLNSPPTYIDIPDNQLFLRALNSEVANESL